MQEDLLTLLLADSGLAAQCGDRIFWGERPQGGAVPALVLHLITRRDDYTLSGPVTAKMTRVQFDIFAETYGEATLSARALSTLLDGYLGTTGNTEFMGIFLDGQQNQRIAGSNDAETLFRVSIDALIHHKEI